MCGAGYRSWPTNKLEDLIRVLKAEHASRFTLDPPIPTTPVMADTKHLRVFNITLENDAPLTLLESDFEREPLAIVIHVCATPSTLTWFDNIQWRNGYPPPLQPNTVMLVRLAPLAVGWSAEMQTCGM